VSKQREEVIHIVINSPLFGNSPYTMNKKICNHHLKILQFIITGSPSLELTGKAAKFLVGRVFSLL